MENNANKNTKKNIRLLIIDPQNDFCDIPLSECPEDPQGYLCIAPALPVTGANEDMIRLAAFIKAYGDQIGDIDVTLDSHSPVDIAHPIWWMDADGNAPSPFTVITVADFSSGKWRTRNPDMHLESERYLSILEETNRYALVVWPEHCLVGSWGHNVHSAVLDALNDWSRKYGRVVNFTFKGLSPNTEHYSAIRAEVVDLSDERTQMNESLLNPIIAADLTIVAGEALSHCVANTVMDIETYAAGSVKNMVLLTDCTSSVGGFEAQGELFKSRMNSAGIRFATSVDFPVELLKG